MYFYDEFLCFCFDVVLPYLLHSHFDVCSTISTIGRRSQNVHTILNLIAVIAQSLLPETSSLAHHYFAFPARMMCMKHMKNVQEHRESEISIVILYWCVMKSAMGMLIAECSSSSVHDHPKLLSDLHNPDCYKSQH